MRKGIHPAYVDCTVTCSCGNSFITRATKPQLRVELCNECHPFYTGQQKFVDTGGRVQRFADKFGSASAAVAEREDSKRKARQEAAVAADAAAKAAREEKAAMKAEKAAKYAEKAAKYAEKAARAASDKPTDGASAELISDIDEVFEAAEAADTPVEEAVTPEAEAAEVVEDAPAEDAPAEEAPAE
ncbi:MAG: 50S ribosomal protein L31 [Coriobacteriia bacterium]|nr:50S ribosomal protein L31 [Coriobacteriia bacterium]